MLQENGSFIGTYLGPGQPTPVSLYPEDGLRPDRLRSFSFQFIDDESIPYIVAGATYESDNGPVVVDQITYYGDRPDEDIAICYGLKGIRRFYREDYSNDIAIFDDYSLGDFARAAFTYVTEALGGVPGPQNKE